MKYWFISFLLASSMFANAQNSGKYYYDLHSHVTLKNFNRQAVKSKQQKEVVTNFDFTDCKKTLEKGMNDANFENFDQAHFSLMTRGRFDVVVTSISPIERSTVIGKRGGVNVLKLIGAHKVTRLPYKKLKSVAKVSSFQDFNDEYRYLKAAVNSPSYKDQFCIANSWADIDSRENEDKTKIILSIEGGHVLFNNIETKDLIGQNGANGIGENYTKDVLGNIDSLKRLDDRIFFITLNHLWWNIISGHAKSLYKPKEKRLLLFAQNVGYLNRLMHNKQGSGLKSYSTQKRTYYLDDSCKPVNRKHERYDNGETKKSYPNTLGRDVVTSLLGTANGKRILVDLRHSDVNTRLDYYSIINELNKNSQEKIPILFSHAAVSGSGLKLAHLRSNRPHFDFVEEIAQPDYIFNRSKDEKFRNCALPIDYPLFWQKANNNSSDYLCTSVDCKTIHKHDIDTNTNRWFFPWSLNIFDEEIAWVYESNGMIGIIAEERVLGAYQYGYKDGDLNNEKVKQLLQTRYGYSKEDAIDFTEVAPLLRNLQYIISRSGKHDTSAWDCVCFSSDFDGLVDPIDVCLTAADVPSMHNMLIRNDGKVVRDFCSIYGYDYSEFLSGNTIDVAFEKFFKGNLKRFIKNNY